MEGGFTRVFGKANKRIAGSIAGVLLVSGVVSSQVLIDAGAAWKYDDTGIDLGTAWRAVGFADSGWASGPAPLGYGDGDEATTLSFGPDSRDKYPTYYFRHAFEIADPNAIADLTLHLRRDDGCVAYLNGIEVVRSNMPGGSITYETFARSGVGSSGERAWHQFSLDPSLLLAGTNVVAVEVHQRSSRSSDITFDLRLGGPAQAPVVILNSPADGATMVPSSALLEVNVSDPDSQSLDVTFYGDRESTADEFTIVALPDTQFYSESASLAPIYSTQTQWIADNADDRNIVFVTHLGDLVEHANVNLEWERANAAMSLLDGIVPYGMGPGNHDQPTTKYNLYFPYIRYASEPWYGGHHADKNDNNFQTFSAGGIDFIIVHIEFCPPIEAIQWADSVLKAHPHHKAILSTHGFLNSGAERSVTSCGSTQYIWDGLVVPNPNVHFVLCGHDSSESRRTDVVNGHPVHQLLSDYQFRTNGGNGFLRNMRFVPAEDKVYVQTYSPWLDQFETDSGSEFALDFEMTGFSVIGTKRDVQSGSNAAVTWTGLDDDEEYEWFVSVTNQTNQTTVSPVFSFSTGDDDDDDDPPEISGVDAIDITDGSATIVWSTDEPADSSVAYGLNTSYGSQAFSTTRVRSHSILLTGLTSRTTYHYRATSADGFGNSASTADFTFTTSMANRPPVAESQSVATLEDTHVAITLTATDPDLDPLTYSVVASPAHGSLSGTAPDLTYRPDRDYDAGDSFTFQANDGLVGGNIATVTISVEPVPDVPGRPQNLVPVGGERSINLDWNDNVEPEGDLRGYNVYRSLTSESYGAAVAFVTASTYLDTSVVQGTTYYYVVTAVDTSALESPASDEVSVATGQNTALQFDGSNDYVTFGRASALGLRKFTLETWFRRDGSGTFASTGTGGVSAVPLISKGRGEGDSTSVDMNYFLGIDRSGRLAADFEEGAGGSSPGSNHPVVGTTVITLGKWHHAAATYDGTTWRLYLDGNLEATLMVGEPPRHDSIQHAALGSALSSSGSPAGFFHGVLDEARIWDRPRTQQEILANMDQEPAGGLGPVREMPMGNHARTLQRILASMSRELVTGTGLVSRWAMNEGAGAVANDSAGGVHGSLTNGPRWVVRQP